MGATDKTVTKELELLFLTNIFYSDLISKLRCRKGGTMRLSWLTQQTQRPLAIALVSFCECKNECVDGKCSTVLACDRTNIDHPFKV